MLVLDRCQRKGKLNLEEDIETWQKQIQKSEQIKKPETFQEHPVEIGEVEEGCQYPEDASDIGENSRQDICHL